MDANATHLLWIAFRHDLFRVAVFGWVCSWLLNIVPKEERIPHRQGRFLYHVLIDFMCACAGHYRVCLPSLNLELVGFKVRRCTVDLAKVKLVGYEETENGH